MKQQIKDELIIELGKVNNSDFELAYNNASGKNKDELKKQIKAILIQLLHENATRSHKTKLGKFGALMSRLGTIILPFVNINKK